MKLKISCALLINCNNKIRKSLDAQNFHSILPFCDFYMILLSDVSLLIVVALLKHFWCGLLSPYKIFFTKNE